MTRLERLTAADTRIFFWISGYRHRPLIGLTSRFCSRAGDGFLYAILGVLLALHEEALGWLFLQTGLLAYALELPAYLLLKNTIQRDRPCDRHQDFQALIRPSDRFSFPSGHAAAAFVFATLISVVYPDWTWLALGFAWAVGCSRVLLGVHYPSDILAGALLGSLMALLALWGQGLI
ncbi:phosphatase PAP2 family protein [Nitrincola tapanii]|uniref:undecaprenyl-diphosphate phosphatase n=1 Tax=Nitrincola tapanii TaxID=1708751 RepID=A0A5A9W4L1_9GAMM|nr:phosphatase PAP2 family protein [Nitrincola tapanii]KAA0874491.1 phosphatase PAP2 family protein [Nitrincola tapanii]